MVSSIFWVSLVLGSVITGLFIWIAWLISKHEEKQEWSFVFDMTGQGEGYCYGRVINIKDVELNNKVVSYEPYDLSVKQLNGKEEKPKQKNVLVEPVELIPLAKHRLSKNKNIYLLFPSDPEKIPEEILMTPLGKVINFGMIIAKADNSVQRAVIEGLERAKNHVIEGGYGVISSKRVDQIKDAAQEIISIYKDTKKDKSSIIPSSTHINPGGF